MTIEISLNGVDVSGLALDSTFKTKNTEILSIIVAKLIGQMAEAGMLLDDGQLPQTQLNTIWAKQDEVIIQQIAYLEDIGRFFQQKHDHLPQQSNWLQEALKSIAGYFASRAVIAATAEYLGPFAEVAGEVAACGVAYAIDALSKTTTKGILLCDAMMAENNALLALAASRKNYELRSMIISQHDRTVSNLLAHVAVLESRIENQSFGNDEEWQDWIDAMGDMTEDLDGWLNDGVDAELSLLDANPDNDLPVPIIPKLPEIPFPSLPSRRNDLPAIIMGQLVKVGGRAFLTYLKRSMEQKSFLRQGDAVQALKDLKYNDEEDDFGAYRTYHRSKIVEY